MTSQSKSVGFIIAAIGGGLGLLAFFAMPFIAYSIISLTGQQVASLAQQASQLGSSSNSAQALLVLWLAPIVAGIIILIAVLQFRSTVQFSAKRAAAGWLIALAIIGIVLYVGILIYLNSFISSSTSSFSSNTPSVFTFIGVGYWVYLVSMIAVIVGASMALSGKAQVQAISGPPPGSPSYPPYVPPPQNASQYPPQYPPYQQPWSQQPQQPQYPPTERAPGSQWPPSQPYQ